ncbi:hypothetical protein Nepgr_019673 [Nepenthes gracilis]|uniref:Cytochrome c oxidase subunit n=1 Tax=Nepenthes gracilis TaxID=150966 RepID=A0AAD3XUC4_NEPGR|nr:hypothetical protein Nepgr_019673 [Nepenthes gracilis]
MAEIVLKTAPADFRFPTTNQTRHCFTRYIEFHRCIAAKGEESNECGKFARYYRSLCPGEWVERWNEQRENGTFPDKSGIHIIAGTVKGKLMRVNEFGVVSDVPSFAILHGKSTGG